MFGFFSKPAPSVPRSPWRFDVLLVAIQCSVVPGSWAPAILPGRENEKLPASGPWSLGAGPWLSAGVGKRGVDSGGGRLAGGGRISGKTNRPRGAGGGVE